MANSFDAGSVTATVKADITQFKQGISEAQGMVSSFGSRMESIGAGIKDFANKATIFTGALTVGLGLATKQAIEMAGNFEQSEIAFTTLLKDRQKALQAIKVIEDEAKKTPYNLPDLIRANQLLISAGVSTKDAVIDIRNLGNAISATGGGTAELNRLAVNMQQIRAVGKASALDIKQFAFAGINVYKLLAEETGKTVEQVREMDVSYELLSKSLARASASGGMFEGAMQNQSKSLQGLISNIQDVIGITLKDIAVQSGLFDAIKNGAQGVLFAIEALKSPIVGVFQAINSAISQSLASGFLKQLVQAFNEFSTWAQNNSETVIGFLQAVAFTIGSLVIIGTVNALLKALLNPFTLVVIALQAFFFAYTTNFAGIRDITNAVIGGIIAIFSEVLIPAFNALKEFIFTNSDEIRLTIEVAWTLIKDIFTIITGIIFELVVIWGGKLFDFLKMLWEKNKNEIIGFWDIIKGIFQVALAILSALVAVFVGLVTRDWDTMWQKVVQASELNWQGLKNIFNGILSFLSGWGRSLYERLVQPVVDAWNKIQELVNKIKDALDFTKRHSPSILDVVKRGVGLVNNALGDLQMTTFVSPQMVAQTAVNGGRSMSIANINIDLNGAIIGNEADALGLAERIGDGIISKLQHSIRI